MVATPQRITMLPDREQVFRMSYEEWQAQIEEVAHTEWVNGEAIVFRRMPDRYHAIRGFVSVLITMYASAFHLGAIRSAPYLMRAIPDGPAREPDIVFVRREHRGRIDEDGFKGPADLAVELVSDESEVRDRVEKFREYAEIGIPEYWLLDPRLGKERADFYQLSADGEYRPILLDAEGRYHSAVLPGFWLKATWLWQSPLPTPLRLLPMIVPQVPSIMQSPAEGE